ncbi:MAG TPA: ThiF family adenylyltransferase [bacterium]|nr:ThiF family adenylyltransferase [bacterium]
MKDFSRYSRQLILKEIGREGQRRLEESRVAVIGIGALGSVSSNLLARAGVGNVVLVDRDYLEIDNLQRQVLFDENDLVGDLPKAVAAKARLEKINSEIKIEAIVGDLSADTAGEFLGAVDIVIDGTDNFETRFLINDYCLTHKIPWIYGGALRTEGMSYVILPGEGPCLRCLFGEAPSPADIQTCEQVGILSPVAHVIASFQAIEAIKILAGHKEAVERNLWKMDLWSREFKSITVDHLRNMPCSGCLGEEFPYLQTSAGTRTVALCGRNAVQVLTPAGRKIDLQGLAARLQGQGEIHFNDYLLRCRTQPYEITVFSNGRAIIKGTEDPVQAKSLYAKYIGA